MKNETSFEMWVTSIFIHTCQELSDNSSLQDSGDSEPRQDLFKALDQLNGYEKDVDFYAAHGDTVEPLPFAQMKTYPYPDKAYPLDEAHFNYLLEYNTRHLSGDEPTGYSYEFRR